MQTLKNLKATQPKVAKSDSMQVVLGEREKKMIKLGILLFRKKFGKRATPEAIHKALDSLNISSVLSLVSIINKAADNEVYKYQRNMIHEYGELGIWILINHPELSETFKRILGRITGTEVEQTPREPVFSKLDLYLMKKILLFTEDKIKNHDFSRYDEVHSDMMYCSNKAVRHVFDIVIEELNTVEDEDIRRISLMYVELLFWILPGDTAYRDPFFWSLYKIGNPTIKRLIKEHPTNLIKSPKNWYGAVLSRARDATTELRESGEISRFGFSESEAICVPEIQNKKLKRIIEGR